jgi:hypothetical protein
MDGPVEVAIGDCASLPRSSLSCLRRGRNRSFTGPISAHHDGLRGTRGTSALGLTMGRACRLRVEASATDARCSPWQESVQGPTDPSQYS